MVEVGEGAELALQAVHRGRQQATQRLERHVLAPHPVVRLEHDAHAAGTEQADDFVAVYED